MFEGLLINRAVIRRAVRCSIPQRQSVLESTPSFGATWSNKRHEEYIELLKRELGKRDFLGMR